MSSLSFLFFAGIVALATGCPRAEAQSQPAQQVPADAGLHMSDALRREPITRDATPLKLDGGAPTTPAPQDGAP